MRTRSLHLTVLVALLVSLVAAPAAAARPPKGDAGEPVPTSMAALGDSITRGFNACGFFFDCTSRSWSTGSGNGVDGHFARLQATDSTMQSAFNLARTGATVDELPGQASAAVSRGAGYVTILIGANDACTSTEAGMTPVADFEGHVRTAMTTLDPDGTGTRVLVTSIPDLRRLWEVGRTSGSALFAWSTYGICQSMLANPLSTAQADVDRRARVRDRVIAYNAVLASVCAEHTNCRYDGGAVFGYPFQLSQLSGWDYFHPNTAGQQVLAAETWAAGFDWAQAKKGGGNGGNGGGGGGGKGGGPRN